jgi:hypothetical protein
MVPTLLDVARRPAPIPHQARLTRLRPEDQTHRMRSRLAVIGVVGVVLMAASCGSPESPTGPEQTAGADARSKPCPTAWVKRHAGRFIAATDSGDRTRLEATIAPAAAFREFSQGLAYGRRSERFFRTRDRQELIDHLVRRRLRGDRTLALSVTGGRYDRDLEICNLSFLLARSIGEGLRRRFIGKGALDVSSGGVAVWNVGPERPRTRSH